MDAFDDGPVPFEPLDTPVPDVVCEPYKVEDFLSLGEAIDLCLSTGHLPLFHYVDYRNNSATTCVYDEVGNGNHATKAHSGIQTDQGRSNERRNARSVVGGLGIKWRHAHKLYGREPFDRSLVLRVQ